MSVSMEGKVRWSSEYYESSSLLAFLPLDLYINLLIILPDRAVSVVGHGWRRDFVAVIG